MDADRRQTGKLLGIIAFAIALFVGMWHLGEVLRVLRLALSMVSFFLVGLSLAFILNAPMRLIETRLFRPLDRRLGKRWARFRRPAAVVLTLLLLVAVLLLVIFMVIPQMARTVAVLADEIPAFLESANAWLDDLNAQYGTSISALQAAEIDWAKLGEAAVNLLQNGAGAFLTGTVNAATSIVSGVFNFFVGVILAVYVLLSKEKLGGQVRRLLYAFLPEKRVDRILAVLAKANVTFTNFVSGQFFEAVILGVLCFLGMSIFGFRFAPMVSVLVGVTAVVPIFGAFIGCAVGAFMILVNQGWLRALWFLVFFIILQQIEGNLIYPHVVGKVMMLPGLWVLVAVTLGGNIAGIGGMLISVPVTSLAYALLREAVDKRNAARGVPRDKLSPGG